MRPHSYCKLCKMVGLDLELVTCKQCVYALHRIRRETEPSETGVAIQLTDSNNSSQVFWGELGNSYVIVPAAENSTPRYCFRTPIGRKVELFSINGSGEIRWVVSHPTTRPEELDAIEYFGLEVPSA